MIKLRKLAVCTLVTLALCACGQEGSDDAVKNVAPAASQTPVVAAPPVPPPVAAVSVPVEVAADAVSVGTVLQGDRVLKSARPIFATSDTIYASASMRGKQVGSDVSVYWTYQNGATDKMETKKLGSGDQTVWFSLAKADGMKPGKYNVEIDVNMTPVGIADFQIK